MPAECSGAYSYAPIVASSADDVSNAPIVAFVTAPALAGNTERVGERFRRRDYRWVR